MKKLENVEYESERLFSYRLVYPHEIWEIYPVTYLIEVTSSVITAYHSLAAAMQQKTSEDDVKETVLDSTKPLESQEIGASFPAYSFGLKKKKKKKNALTATEGDTIIDGTKSVFVRGPVHDYTMLLQRIKTFIESKNPELQENKRYTIKPPQLARIGSKKVAWTNFYEICNIMQRTPDHVLQFVLAELGTEGSIGGDGQLTLKGKFGPKHIESLLRKYIIEYVTCSMCKSPSTTLSRDSSTRLFNIHCSACGASRSVTTIRSGFHAVSRADRRKAKQAV